MLIRISATFKQSINNEMGSKIEVRNGFKMSFLCKKQKTKTENYVLLSFQYCLNFCVFFVLIFWRCCDVRRTRIVLIFVSLERGDPWLYIGSKRKGMGRFYIE